MNPPENPIQQLTTPLFGSTGDGDKSPRGVFADLIAWVNSTGAPIFSLDVPSGMDSTTGGTPGEFIKAIWTMTLALPKTGLASSKARQIVLADIGIPEEMYRRIGLTYAPPFGNRFRVLLSARANKAVFR